MTAFFLFLERRFRRISEEAEDSTILSTEDFASEPVVVVLGDPGLGKTTQFKRDAERAGVELLPIRRFLGMDARRIPRDELYLDGLDEVRASRSSDRRGVLDQVVKQLYPLHPRPKIRLSCRAADWLGELDRSDLAELSPSGKVLVVELLPLNEDEVERFVRDRLADADAFLESIRGHEMGEWLTNPQTLELMIKVAKEGALPHGRTELFEKACSIMAREGNRGHREAKRDGPEEGEILDAAGYLCALYLIAGQEGFVNDPDDAGSRDCIALRDLSPPEQKLRAALESRLFRWEQGRAVPVHRTIAEFLAARLLCDRVRGGLPLSRPLRLITGDDGGTLSDLRGLYAWLTTLLTEDTDTLVQQDPIACILYGDADALTISAKRSLLKSLRGLADRNPWFFYEGARSRHFGSLADPGLVPDFRAILTAEGQPPYLVMAVLAALAYGHSLPELSGDLSALVCNPARPVGTRELALDALIHAGVSDAKLASILKRIHEGELDDDDDRQRAQLLQRLYPRFFGPGEMLRYLTPPKRQGFIGTYYRLVSEGIGQQTPDELLPSLLDRLSDTPQWGGRRQVWQKFVGSLLQRALEIHGDSVPVDRIWSWLQVGFDGRAGLLRAEDSRAIRDWFSARPGRMTEMYQWWVTEGASSEPALWDLDFWRALCYPSVPADLWRLQLSLAEAWGADERGRALFRAVVWAMGRGAERPTLEELFSWVDEHPDFRADLSPLLVSELHSWHFRPLDEAVPEPSEEEVQRQNREFIQAHLAAVRAGRDLGILEHLSHLFLGFAGGTGSHGLKAIEQRYGSEIASAAAEGFIAAMELEDQPSPVAIGRLSSARKEFTVCSSLVAAMALQYERQAMPSLDHAGARAALAHEFAVFPTTGDWWKALVQSDPAKAAEVVLAAWSPMLEGDKDGIPHLSDEEVLASLAPLFGGKLLAQYPRSKRSLLAQLMRFALVGGSREELATMAVLQLEDPRDLDRQLDLWLALALLVDPEGALPRVQTYVSGPERTPRAYALIAALEDLEQRGWVSSLPTTVLAVLIELLGTACPPHETPSGPWSGRHDC